MTVPPTSESMADSLLREIAAAPAVSVPAELATLVLLEPGVVVDGVFRIDERIGAGGMGVVYAARDLVLDREVALKLMRLERSAGAVRGKLPDIFEREAQATARLNHPNVVTLHQFGDWNGLLYLVLERLRGVTLHARLERGRLSLASSVMVIEQVARALVHTHAAGIVHRDLKPQNVFLQAAGGVKVLDFGVSGLALAPCEPAPVSGTDVWPTSTLSRAGTPGYMAPEQWWGGMQDERTDLWAVGVMLYQLISGALPFGLAPVRDDARAPALHEHLPAGAENLASLVERCLALRREDRLGSAAELVDALAEIRTRLQEDGGDGVFVEVFGHATARARRRWSRLPVLAVLAIAAVVLAAVELPGTATPIAEVVDLIAAPPPDPAMIDYSGRWSGPEGEFRLAWAGADTYRVEYEGRDRSIPARSGGELPRGPVLGRSASCPSTSPRSAGDPCPSPPRASIRSRGEVRLQHLRNQLVLLGTYTDVDGACCGDATDVEMVVAGPDHLVLTRRIRKPNEAMWREVVTGWELRRSAPVAVRWLDPAVARESAARRRRAAVIRDGDHRRLGVLVGRRLVLTSSRGGAIAGSASISLDGVTGPRSGAFLTAVPHPWKPVTMIQSTVPLGEASDVMRSDDRQPVLLFGIEVACAMGGDTPLVRFTVERASQSEIVLAGVPGALEPGAPCFSFPGTLLGIVDRVEDGRIVLVRSEALQWWYRYQGHVSEVRARAARAEPDGAMGPMRIEVAPDPAHPERRLCLDTGDDLSWLNDFLVMPCHGGPSQRFYLDPSIEGGWAVTSDLTGFCLNHQPGAVRTIGTYACAALDSIRIFRDRMTPSGSYRYRTTRDRSGCVTAGDGRERGRAGARVRKHQCASGTARPEQLWFEVPVP